MVKEKKRRRFAWNDLNGFALVVLALSATIATAAISEADYRTKAAQLTEKAAAETRSKSFLKWAFCSKPNEATTHSDRQS